MANLPSRLDPGVSRDGPDRLDAPRRRRRRARLGLTDRELPEVEDRGRQHRVGPGAVTPSTRWSSVPTPPDGDDRDVAGLDDRAVRSRSKPSFVPSRSMEVSRISPAPSVGDLARPTPRRRGPTGVRPPWVNTSQPAPPSVRRRASIATTTHCAPNSSAISEMSSGRSTAAVFTPTLSAPARSRRRASSTRPHPSADGEGDEHLLGDVARPSRRSSPGHRRTR